MVGSRERSVAARRSSRNRGRIERQTGKRAAAWEIATKHRLGKLPGAEALARDVAGTIANQGFEELTITVDDAVRAGTLPGPHRDPFDRILIAQALSRNLVLVSIETLFDQYGVRRLW